MGIYRCDNSKVKIKKSKIDSVKAEALRDSLPMGGWREGFLR
jgi:hypothetical protein